MADLTAWWTRPSALGVPEYFFETRHSLRWRIKPVESGGYEVLVEEAGHAHRGFDGVIMTYHRPFRVFATAEDALVEVAPLYGGG